MHTIQMSKLIVGDIFCYKITVKDRQSFIVTWKLGNLIDVQNRNTLKVEQINTLYDKNVIYLRNAIK